MTRLRILPLPGDGQPFAVVIDRANENDLEALGFTDEPASRTLNQAVMSLCQQTPAQRLASELGARTVIVFEQDIELPGDEFEDDEEILRLTGERDELHAEIGLAHGQLHSAALSAIRGKHANIRELIERAERAETERDEARTWARHGYEIGQRHCGWTDHGVAPEWLTEDWPRAIDPCEHLKLSADFDTRITAAKAIHRRVEWHGMTLCAKCSAYRGDGNYVDNAPVDWPCDTIKALDGTP